MSNKETPIGIPKSATPQDIEFAIRRWWNTRPIWALATNLPVYTDNAAALAGGLIAGDLYKTSTGTLMIVY
jgi:hypothetical protein